MSAARGPSWPYFSTTKAFMIAVLWARCCQVSRQSWVFRDVCVVLEDASVAGVDLWQEDVCNDTSFWAE